MTYALSNGLSRQSVALDLHGHEFDSHCLGVAFFCHGLCCLKTHCKISLSFTCTFTNFHFTLVHDITTYKIVYPWWRIIWIVSMMAGHVDHNNRIVFSQNVVLHKSCFVYLNYHSHKTVRQWESQKCFFFIFIAKNCPSIFLGFTWTVWNFPCSSSCRNGCFTESSMVWITSNPWSSSTWDGRN